jgi:hypothetical protein
MRKILTCLITLLLGIFFLYTLNFEKCEVKLWK